MSNLNLGRLFFVISVLTLQGLSLPTPNSLVQDVFKIQTLGHSRFARRELDATTYETYQISDGTAGNAKEAASKLFLQPFGLTLSPELEVSPIEALKSISKEDINAMFKIGHEGNVQEKEGFNQAIEAAKGNKELLATLKRGKTANKVLKLMAQVVGLAAQVAQGGEERKEKLEKEKKKLAHNIETDEKNKGKPMSSFLSGSTSGTSTHQTESDPESTDETEQPEASELASLV
ncbi:uncharacterized protein MELLADRAFT_123231 [Melampsora larici-populina 98AG31]|uniref:Secreted protein n=1 Tax=Melampsora larici-populina (strain 98AG31 / pathotype 3-4-7) TaxID=747676 RepID=F4RNN6_MELLP|nr:uncharacterized protein MELLADRAFT_123231 [Melampsora larici-populina 98AG31]EGG06062.1 secreted protein [Melampsora larici-populina 98AG31]